DFEGFESSTTIRLNAWTTAINPGPISGRAKSPTRSTPTGLAFLFQSHARLTAYDNDGKGEIYRYDPTASTERLLCVSCDPSGAPPTVEARLQNPVLGGIDGVQYKTVIQNITDDGTRAFFETQDSLLPEDANEVDDVYEWAANGAGNCRRSGGCLALITSG